MWIWLLLKSISTNSSFLISIYIDFTIGEFYFICVMKMYLINVASQFYKSYSLSWFLISQESIDYIASIWHIRKKWQIYSHVWYDHNEEQGLFLPFLSSSEQGQYTGCCKEVDSNFTFVQQWLQNMILQRYRVKVSAERFLGAFSMVNLKL